MKDIERYWKVEFENGEVAIIKALNKRTANLYADSLEDEVGYEVTKIEEIDW